MASSVEQLKNLLYDMSNRSMHQASGLAEYRSSFSKEIPYVQQIVGGSARKIDTDLIDALNFVVATIQRAEESLYQASQRAKGYADSI